MMQQQFRFILEPLESRRHLAVDLTATFAYGTFDPQTNTINCDAVVTNIGDAAPSGLYKIRWFLSRDQVINNSDDIVLKEATLGNSPLPNHSIERFDSPVVPYTVPDGAYFVGFAVDVDNTIQEDSDLNNYQFTAFPALFIDSEPIIFNGTDKDDTISLTPGADVAGHPQLVLTLGAKTIGRFNPYRAEPIQINGGGGNDLITINDDITNPVRIDGGAGSDTIHGGGGNDSIYGGSENDTLYGGPGNDRISGNGSKDLIFGEAGKDRLYGNGGNDRLDGGSGDDRLYGGAGRDYFFGAAGNDRIYSRDGVDEQINGGSGRDSAQIDLGFEITTSIESLIA
jgi:Ca2+-binding RTX toxin-like protein